VQVLQAGYEIVERGIERCKPMRGTFFTQMLLAALDLSHFRFTHLYSTYKPRQRTQPARCATPLPCGVKS
jgi:hypothetical protein